MSATLDDAIPPAIWKPTNAEYHATTEWWGSSMLKDFRQSARTAAGRYVFGTLPTREATWATTAGAIAHELILGPVSEAGEGELDNLVIFRGPGRDSKAFAAAELEHAPAWLVTPSEWAAGEKMAHAILYPATPAAEDARALLVDAPGRREYSYRWTSAEGVPVKVRLDALSATTVGLALTDLKTSRDVGPAFSRQYSNMDYECQAALYERGVYEITGERPAVMVVSVGNTPPYEVAVDEVDDELLDAGREQIEKDLLALRRCLDSGEWVSQWEQSIGRIKCPAWKRRKR